MSRKLPRRHLMSWLCPRLLSWELPGKLPSRSLRIRKLPRCKARLLEWLLCIPRLLDRLLVTLL